MNPKGTVKPYQKVVTVGSMVREAKPGDVVMIDPSSYIKKKYSDIRLFANIYNIKCPENRNILPIFGANF